MKAIPSTLTQSDSDCSDGLSFMGARTVSGYTVGRCSANKARPPIELKTCKALLKGCSYREGSISAWFVLSSKGYKKTKFT